MDDVARAHAIIRGRVQGVSFRAWTTNQANELALTGWVRNMADGSVEAIFEGAGSAIEKIVEAVKIGPRFALVEDVTVEYEPPTGEFAEFEIRR